MKITIRSSLVPRPSVLVGAVSILLLVAFAGAQDSLTKPAAQSSAAPKVLSACSAGAPMQGTQQINVCSSWSALPGANIELFNTTGNSCAVISASPTWPFSQSAGFVIPDMGSVWVTLLSTLPSGQNYTYNATCCPQETPPIIIVV